MKVGRERWEEKGFAEEDKVAESGIAEGERSQEASDSRIRAEKGSSSQTSRTVETCSAMPRR